MKRCLVGVTLLLLAVGVSARPDQLTENRPCSEAAADSKRLLATREASDLDPALPELPFEDWLRDVLPVNTKLIYEVCDCEEHPDGDTPGCLSVYADVVSRARQMRLFFDEDGSAYRGGAVSSDKLEGTVRVELLSGLDRALKKGLRPYPLVCPNDTSLELKEEHAGLYEWCEDGQGRKQGPYRVWFSTGIYLMQDGVYEDGAKTGTWIECNRFERCKTRNYSATEK